MTTKKSDLHEQRPIKDVVTQNYTSQHGRKFKGNSSREADIFTLWKL